jgi:hypothetical protein
MRKVAVVQTGIGTKKLAMGHFAAPIMRPTPPRDYLDNVTANVQVIKTVDETINSSDVLQNDDELFFTLDANSEYVVEGHFNVETGAGGFQDIFTYPADATLGLQMRLDSNLQNGDYSASVKFTLTTVSAGTLQYQWAQLASDASDTTVLAGSYLSYIKTPFVLI